MIRRREDAHGFGQLRDPLNEAGLALLPVWDALGVIFGKFEAAMSVGADDLLEVVDPLDEEFLVALAVGGEVPVATFVEVLGHHAADILIIAAHERSAAGEVGGAEFNGRQARGRDQFGGLGAKGAGQDAVAVPILQPGRRRGIEGAEFEVGRPRPVGCDVAPDPGEQLTRVAAGSLDEQGDPRGAAMGGGGHGL